MRKTLVPLIALAALASSSQANATTGYAPADSYQQLGGPLSIARTAWPNSACTGNEQIQLVTPPLYVPGTEQQTIGVALSPGCRLQLDETIIGNPVLTCYVLAHEFGHLSGIWTHSADPNDIMSQGSRWAPCNQLAPPHEPAPAPTTPVAQTPVVTKPPAVTPRTKKHKRKTGRSLGHKAGKHTRGQ